MENSKKLYKVTLKGMTYNSTGTAYGLSYVIAKDMDEAYQKVKTFLDENKLGFDRERELDKIEVLADSCNFYKNLTGYILYL